MVTIHGTGFAAFAKWGGGAQTARCRWAGSTLTIPTALSDTAVICASAAQQYTTSTTTSVELARAARDLCADHARKG